MKNAIKIFNDESFDLEMLIKNKIQLLKSPVDLLNGNEIKELRNLLADYSHKVENLIKIINGLYEKNDKDKNKNLAPIEENENYHYYQDILKKYKDIQNQIEGYFLQYEEKEIIRQNKINSMENFALNIKDDENSDLSDYADKDRIEISRVFLNSFITTLNVSILQRKKTLQEEQDYILEIFDLKESYPHSESKQQILIDYYINNYKYCLNQKFSIEKISTFLSIIYFIFTFSVMNKKIIKEKSLNLFIEIVDYHSLNRPPISYEIFTSKEKDKIVSFVNFTFYRNYTLFENIFKYNLNIYFHSVDFKKIPKINFPTIHSHNLEKNLIHEDPKNIKLLHKLYFESEINKKKVEIKIETKSDIELKRDAELEKLKTFVNSFYKSKEAIESETVMQENYRVGKIIESEVNETKAILGTKVPEIMKETNYKIDLANKEIVKNVNHHLNSILDAKNKK